MYCPYDVEFPAIFMPEYIDSFINQTVIARRMFQMDSYVKKFDTMLYGLPAQLARTLLVSMVMALPNPCLRTGICSLVRKVPRV
jgi:hypothetical protein